MRKKMARMAKLVKLRENTLKMEVGKLHAIRAQLTEVTDRLKAVQGQYFATIDHLNQQRSTNPHQLQLWEDGVDCYKHQLHELIQRQKTWQDREDKQRAAVLAARLAVQSLAKLGERYSAQWQQLSAEQEQSEQDEFSVLSAAGFGGSDNG